MIIPLVEMYPGETAEIVSIDVPPGHGKRIRDMGLREGGLIDLLHKDMECSRKIIVGCNGLRLAFDLLLLSGIRVRPIRSSYEALKTQAHYDSLTGCLNRHVMDDLCTAEYEKYTRHSIPVSILIADIDHFKRINDTFGHSMGDSVLKGISLLLKSSLRRSDSICRWGGEEFLILLRNTFLNEAVQIAERLRTSVEIQGFQPFLSPGGVTVSIGSSSLPPDAGIRDLFVRADLALYDAKHAGRNCVKLCEASI